MQKQLETKQMRYWRSKEGRNYTERSSRSVKEMNDYYKREYGVTRSEMNTIFLDNLNRNIKILEVGANIGCQLELLRKMGYRNLIGIEINAYVTQRAKQIHPKVDIIKGHALNLPFKDNYFDLVFTSGALIHIAPRDLKKVMQEIVGVCKTYIWGFEYFAPKTTAVAYRGKKDLLWKTDFEKAFLSKFKNLKLVKEQKFPIKNSKNINQMYLLKKSNLKK